jgi:tetratricopeptide (TPR) repeat protein
VSRQQREAVDELLRAAPLDLGGDVNEQRIIFEELQFALNFFARSQLASGRLTEAAALLEEERVIAQAAVGYEEMPLAAWRGQESLASELIERMVQTASARGIGRMVDVATHAKAVLYNGIGRYEVAHEAARAAFEHRDDVGYGPFVVAELAEAASRTGDQTLIGAALEWLAERTGVTPH